MKKTIIVLSFFILLFLIGCGNEEITSFLTTQTTNSTTETSTSTTNVVSSTQTTLQTTTSGTTTLQTTLPTTTAEVTTLTTINENIEEVIGLESADVILNHYFNPTKDVKILTTEGDDITSLLKIEGNVDYGTVGSYSLIYSLEFDEETLSTTRVVNVIEGSYVAPSGSRPTIPTGKISLLLGSYFNGVTSLIDHPTNPIFIESDLLDYAIPSNGWWTSLLVANHGGSNGIYTNPLRTSFVNEGLEITNPLDGFVQYWNVNDLQTIAQFPISLKDSFLRSSDLISGYTTKVIDYSDSHVKVSMKNNSTQEDNVVVTLVQGSPYVFIETSNRDSLSYTLDVNGVDNYEYFDVGGNLITGNTYTGDSVIVKMVHRHSGYNTSPPANVLSPQFEDKYYLVNAPDETVFQINSRNHPFGLLNNLDMDLGDGNYLSIAAINNLSEASFYHEHGYSFITNTNTDFDIDYSKSIVNTHYEFSSQLVRAEFDDAPIVALMPHHYKYSDVETTEFSYRTVRGTLKVMEGNYFNTELSFNGLVPGYTLPDNTEFSSATTVEYLQDLDTQIDLTDPDGFINDEAPYWNGKAIYPLSQGIIIADQLGEEVLKNSFIDKLKYILEDWYSYTNSSDEKFLYYNNAWGTVYYSNNDFNTASELSDHSFTHGYLIYASSVLAMYDQDFVDNYGMIVDLLLDDYMFPQKDNGAFRYLRNFDTWAGHSWAHGFGTFAEGNNLESTSEALNSWSAGYLWAQATGDQDRMEAAIYGFATELSAIKEYWFDYDDENWDPAFGDYVDVAGIVWGGKHDYATWFGANPTFIYGIQWLPTGEYLTNYAINEFEYNRLHDIFTTYLAAKSGVIDTWYTNMWSIQAIIDPVQAMQNFDSLLVLGDDYPAELVGAYWMINSLQSLNKRTEEVWMKLELGISSTIYEITEGQYVALVWNSSEDSHNVVFYTEDGVLYNATINAKTFTKIDLN